MKVKELVTSYIQQPKTDFAILVNGKWGSGKTHYFKNTIAEEIEQIDWLPETQQDKPIKFELIYVSLYGLTSADELAKKLFLAINSNLQKKGIRLGMAVIGKEGNFLK